MTACESPPLEQVTAVCGDFVLVFFSSTEIDTERLKEVLETKDVVELDTENGSALMEGMQPLHYFYARTARAMTWADIKKTLREAHMPGSVISNDRSGKEAQSMLAWVRTKWEAMQLKVKLFEANEQWQKMQQSISENSTAGMQTLAFCSLFCH
eukprot:464678-Rhodomonas_salina.1